MPWRFQGCCSGWVWPLASVARHDRRRWPSLGVAGVAPVRLAHSEDAGDADGHDRRYHLSGEPASAQAEVAPEPLASAPGALGAGPYKTVPLAQIAFGRSGDKGDICNVGIVARSPEAYETLRSELTADRVRAHFGDLVTGTVERYEMPGIRALNFVLHGSLDGGGTRSLRSDHLGKTMYTWILRMELDERTWHLVRHTPKVTGFVGGKNPAPIPESEVEDIKSQMAEGRLKPKPKVTFTEGENVRVIDGPFSNFSGIVETIKADKGKVVVLVSIFGRATPVELDFTQVEKS